MKKLLTAISAKLNCILICSLKFNFASGSLILDIPWKVRIREYFSTFSATSWVNLKLIPCGLFILFFILLTGYSSQITVLAPILPTRIVYEPPPPVHIYEAEYIPYEDELPEPEEYEIRRPMVALTFDDGPAAHTERILDVLEKYDGRATFFVLGHRIESWQYTIARAAYLGNEIANHAWSHTNLTRLNEESITWEIQATSTAIESITGFSPPILRPPFGQTNARVRYVAEELGYALINWDIDTLDWRYRDPDRIYDVIMNGVEDGSVILLHDIHGTTADAMERVIPSLIEAGYQLVTVSELLEYFWGELEPGRVYLRVFDLG